MSGRTAMKRKLIILGTKGLAREVAMIAERINDREHRWEFCGFVGGTSDEAGKNLGLGSILGDDDWLLSQNFAADLVIGIGRPKIRAKTLSLYREQSRFEYPNLIDPRAFFDFRRLEFGCGNVVTAGCAFTCDIRVKDFNYFNLNTTVGHDVNIGSFNVINPGVNISGGARFADRVLVGTGSQILEDARIDSDATIGAGAVVKGHVPAGQTVVGIPAKPIEPHHD